jgi:hypothetical protein
VSGRAPASGRKNDRGSRPCAGHIKNHLLGIEFDRYIREHPELLEQIPDDAEVFFLPDDDPELARENLQIAEAQKGYGKDVLLVRIGKLAPPRSRLEHVRLEALPAA